MESAGQEHSGAILEEREIFDLLSLLSDRSLVATEEHNGETRYRLLESVRQYASDRLAETGEVGVWRDRHLASFLALAEEAQPHLLGPAVQTWQARLEIEHDNLRSALAWGTTHSTAPEIRLRLCSALHYFWLGCGYFGEGRNWCRAALDRTDQGVRTAARASALLCAAGMAYAQGDLPVMIALDEESLSIWRELENPKGIAQALNGLGITACDQGDYEAARSFHEQSLAIRRKVGDPWTISQSLCNLGVVDAAQGDFSTARRLLEESLAIRRRELGIHRGTAIVLHSLGKVAFEEGDYVSARSLLEESLSIRREVMDLSRTAESLVDVGNVALELGDADSARLYYRESLSICAELRIQESLARLFESSAGLVLAAGDFVSAARLWGAAEALRQQFGGTPWLSEQNRLAARVSVARAALHDDDIFDAAWQDGRGMSLEAAIAHAHEAISSGR